MALKLAGNFEILYRIKSWNNSESVLSLNLPHACRFIYSEPPRFPEETFPMSRVLKRQLVLHPWFISLSHSMHNKTMPKSSKSLVL